MPRSKPKKDKAKEFFWRRAVARQIESGLSQNAFCDLEGFAASSFSYWKNELARRDGEKPSKARASASLPVFVPLSQSVADVDLTVVSSITAGAIAEIDLGAGSVRLFSGIDQNSLRDIIKALKEVAF